MMGLQTMKEARTCLKTPSRLRRSMMSGAIFGGLLLLCLWFVGWIGKLAFDNTCIGLKEQYISSSAKETAGEIVTGLSFGKSMDSFYGMDRILERVCALAPEHLEAAVLDSGGLPMYSSFDRKECGREYLARLLSDAYQEKLHISLGKGGGITAFGSLKSMILPLEGQNGDMFGTMVLIYNTDTFVLGDRTYVRQSMTAILAVLTVAMTVFYLLSRLKKIPKKPWGLIIPVLAVMAGVLSQIVVLYGHYQKEYGGLIYENARDAAQGIGETVNSILEKGLPQEELGRLSGYFADKANNNDGIWNIRIIHPYADTGELLNRREQDAIIVTHLQPEQGAAVDVLVSVNQRFIAGQMRTMTASFLVLFIICAMVSFELVKLIDILGMRIEEKIGCEGAAPADGTSWAGGLAPAAGQSPGHQAVPPLIKLMSFVVYTGIYASMPYAAVLMRSWNASVWRFSPEISASLPLSLELFGIMVCSALIPRYLGKIRISRLLAAAAAVLIAGNAGCAMAAGPYSLIAMRAVTSLGFALFKYVMNSIVSAGSLGGTRLNSNYALLNAGLLGGITVGGSIGAIVAGAMGYQFNYYFTAAIILTGFAAGFMLMPWNILEEERKKSRGQEAASGIHLGTLFKNPRVATAIILGAVPLNIGLMYVVAFLPVYMDHAGQSALAVSYAYLINGLCGVYIGVFLVRISRGLPQKFSVTASMALAAAGILVLTVGHSLGLVMVSAGIMGLFDGYGTPNITGWFASIPEVKMMDGARALTIFNVAGSAVQTICPLLYNMTIQTDGKTTYLSMLGLGFVAVACALLLTAGEKRAKKPKGEAV